MGVVLLTCCQPHPTARHPQVNTDMENYTFFFFFFYNPHLFRMCHTQQPQKSKFSGEQETSLDHK